jgi:hypothetical protein
VAQIKSRTPKIEKGATVLMNGSSSAGKKSSTTVAAVPSPLKLASSSDPMEILLRAVILVSDSDLETLASERAKTVRAYILQSGKVEAGRLFLTENQTGGVRSDGSRVYLQFQ